MVYKMYARPPALARARRPCHPAVYRLEVDMPCLGSRFSSWTIDNLTSWLGLYNPFARAYDPETEALWLLDNVAWRSPTYPYHWTAEFVAAYFLKNSGKELAEVASYLGRKLGVEKGSRNEETMRQRLKPFVDTILPARTVYVSVGDEEEELRLGPGGRNGISANVLKMPGYGDYDDGDRLDTVAATGQESAEMCMTTVFAEPEGWAVISGNRSSPGSICHSNRRFRH